MSAIGDQRLAAAAAGSRRVAPTALLVAWGPVVVWAAVILSLSSDRFSDVHTAGWLSRIAGDLGISTPLIEVANFIVRKLAHFVEYAILSMLTFRALVATWPERRRRQLLVIAVAMAAAWAGLDELYQHVATVTRLGTPKDVVLDTVGAVAGAVVGTAHLYRRTRRRAT